MSSPNHSSFRTLTKHKPYYIPGADLCILVENVQFRVHRYFFERESEYFRIKLLTPASPGMQPKGTNDSNAIILDDDVTVTVDQFERFLWVFYNPLYSLYDAEISDWEIILSLAVRWKFPHVKDLAVRELEKKEMPDSKRIKLYHANEVDRNILIPRYAALCQREAHLTLEEAQDVGMETVVMIAAGREEVRTSRLASGVKSPVMPTVQGAQLHDVIKEVFNIVPVTPSDSNSDPPAEDNKKTNGTDIDPTGDSTKNDEPNQKKNKQPNGGHTKGNKK